MQLTLFGFNASDQNVIQEWQEFRVVSTTNSGVTMENCKGFIKIELVDTCDMSVGHHTYNDLEREETHATRAAQERLTALENTLYQKLDPETFYGQLDLSGNYWGPSFAAITDFTLGDSDAIGKSQFPMFSNQCLGILCSRMSSTLPH